MQNSGLADLQMLGYSEAGSMLAKALAACENRAEKRWDAHVIFAR
jgi:hypothetical protein